MTGAILINPPIYKLAGCLVGFEIRLIVKIKIPSV